MPDYSFTSPEGKEYKITGPNGSTREEAFKFLPMKYPELKGKPGFEQNDSLTDNDPLKSIDQSAGDKALKVGASMAGGMAGGMANPLKNLFGATGKSVSELIDKAEHAFGDKVQQEGSRMNLPVPVTAALATSAQMLPEVAQAVAFPLKSAGKLLEKIPGAIKSGYNAAGKGVARAGDILDTLRGKGIPGAQEDVAKAQIEAAKAASEKVKGAREVQQRIDQAAKDAESLHRTKEVAAKTDQQNNLSKVTSQVEKELADLKARSSTEVKGQAKISEAHNRVVSRLTKYEDAAKGMPERHLDSMSKTPVRDEEMGAHIQTSGQKNIASEHANTIKTAITETKDPLIIDSKTRAAAVDYPENNPASAQAFKSLIEKIKAAKAEAPQSEHGNFDKLLNDLQGTKLEAEPKFYENGTRMPSEDKNVPIGADTLEGIRRIAEKSNGVDVSGYGSYIPSFMRGKDGISGAIRNTLNAYDKRYGEFVEKYSSGKKSEESISSGKKGLSITKADAEVDGNPVFNTKPQAAASYYMDGTKTSAEKMVRLVGGDKSELSKMVLGNLRDKVEGMSAEQARSFMKKNRGLLDVFPNAKQPLSNYIKSKEDHANIVKKLDEAKSSAKSNLKKTVSVMERADEAIRSAKESGAKTVEKEAEKVESAGAVHKQLAEDYKKSADIIRDPETPVENIPTQAMSLAKKMFNDGTIDQAKYYSYTKQIQHAKRLFEKQIQAEKNIASAEKNAENMQKLTDKYRLNLLKVLGGSLGLYETYKFATGR